MISFIVTLTTLGMLTFIHKRKWENRGREEPVYPDEPQNHPTSLAQSLEIHPPYLNA
jgi:hypothetical protein